VNHENRVELSLLTLTAVIPSTCIVRIIPDCRHQSSIDPSRSPRESRAARTVCGQLKPESSKEEDERPEFCDESGYQAIVDLNKKGGSNEAIR
jgi:hypothetical protein